MVARAPDSMDTVINKTVINKTVINKTVINKTKQINPCHMVRKLFVQQSGIKVIFKSMPLK